MDEIYNAGSGSSSGGSKLNFKKMWGGVKKGADETLGIIDATMTILNNYPDLNESDEDIKLSYQASLNPLPFLLNLLERVGGYEIVIQVIAHFICLGVPVMEAAVKLAMLLNLRHLFSCTINPMITNKMLKEGMVFDISQLDFTNMLEYSPMKKTFDNKNNPNRYNYFGCDDFRFTDELADAGDFNAFLWYVKHKAIKRLAWRGVSLKDSFFYADVYLQSRNRGTSALYQKPKLYREVPTDSAVTEIYEWRLPISAYQKLSMDVIRRNNFSLREQDLGRVSYQAKNVSPEVYQYLKNHDADPKAGDDGEYGYEGKGFYTYFKTSDDGKSYQAEVDQVAYDTMAGKYDDDGNYYYYKDKKPNSEGDYEIAIEELYKLFKRKGNPDVVSKLEPSQYEDHPDKSKYKKVTLYGEKDKKGHGIITLEYNGSSASLRNSVGEAMGVATPSYNNIHVFIGCAESMSTRETLNAEQELLKNNKKLEELERKNSELSKKISDNYDKYHKLREKANKLGYVYNILPADDDEKGKKNWEKGKKYSEEAEKYYKVASDCEKEKKVVEKDLKAAQEAVNEIKNQLHARYMTDNNFKPIQSNYYYHRTLFEFNYDYIMSLKLFDAKTLVHQLISQLTNCFQIDIDLSYERLVVKEQVKNIIQKIIQSGITDSVISDCYFLFDNEEYDKMMQKADLIRAGLYTANGEINSTTQMNLDVLESINNISPNASQEEMITTVTGALIDINYEVEGHSSNPRRPSGGDTEQSNSHFHGNVNAKKFYENIISNLTEIIVSVIVSPKLYLLYAVNLKTVGTFHPLSYQGFLSEFAKTIAEAIQNIINCIQEYLQKQLFNIIVENFMKQVAVYFSLEKLEYYRELIQRCIDCFNNSKNIGEFQDDIIQYADIYDQSEPEQPEEC